MVLKTKSCNLLTTFNNSSPSAAIFARDRCALHAVLAVYATGKGPRQYVLCLRLSLCCFPNNLFESWFLVKPPCAAAVNESHPPKQTQERLK